MAAKKRLKGSPKVTSKLIDAAVSGILGKPKRANAQPKAVSASKKTGSGGLGQAARNLRQQRSANKRALKELLGD